MKLISCCLYISLIIYIIIVEYRCYFRSSSLINNRKLQNKIFQCEAASPNNACIAAACSVEVLATGNDPTALRSFILPRGDPDDNFNLPLTVTISDAFSSSVVVPVTAVVEGPLILREATHVWRRHTTLLFLESTYLSFCFKHVRCLS